MTDPKQVQELGRILWSSQLCDDLSGENPGEEVRKLGNRAGLLIDDIRSALDDIPPRPNEHELISKLRFLVEWTGLDREW